MTTKFSVGDRVKVIQETDLDTDGTVYTTYEAAHKALGFSGIGMVALVVEAGYNEVFGTTIYDVVFEDDKAEFGDSADRFGYIGDDLELVK